MALSYSAFGNNGNIRQPKLILAIYNAKGQALYKAEDNDEFQLKFKPKRRVISGDTAEIMVSLLRDCAKRSGISRKTRAIIGDFVGKTGTTDGYRDAWFIGLTPKVTAALWVGFDDPSFAMKGGTGSRLAAPLWGRIIRHSPVGAKKFLFSPRAQAVQICPSTGSSYTSNCPAGPQTELFRYKDQLHHLRKPILSNSMQVPLNESSDF